MSKFRTAAYIALYDDSECRTKPIFKTIIFFLREHYFYNTRKYYLLSPPLISIINLLHE